MSFQKGDTVTQRGVWLPATVTQVGEEQLQVRWKEYAKIGFPEFSFLPVESVISWEEAQKEIMHPVYHDTSGSGYDGQGDHFPVKPAMLKGWY